ncbi:hypothetical protein M0802_009778 [Mischocyttarus mexicanus]|nr:hypothetical protein M0802_009778 [Mischocyttarus mexicanus]
MKYPQSMKVIFVNNFIELQYNKVEITKRILGHSSSSNNSNSNSNSNSRDTILIREPVYLSIERIDINYYNKRSTSTSWVNRTEPMGMVV